MANSGEVASTLTLAVAARPPVVEYRGGTSDEVTQRVAIAIHVRVGLLNTVDFIGSQRQQLRSEYLPTSKKAPERAMGLVIEADLRIVTTNATVFESPRLHKKSQVKGLAVVATDRPLDRLTLI
jgi:hypothetical protein